MMSPLTKAAVAFLAGIGLAAAGPSRAAALALPYTYSFAPSPNVGGAYLNTLTINDPFAFNLSSVVITESLVSDPTVFQTTTTFLDGVTPLAVMSGKSITSDVDFALPYGDQPQNVLFDPQAGPLPFVLSATATGNGQTYGFSLTQTYNPDGTPTAAVPEAGPAGLLTAGLGLLAVAGLRRKRTR